MKNPRIIKSDRKSISKRSIRHPNFQNNNIQILRRKPVIGANDRNIKLCGNISTVQFLVIDTPYAEASSANPEIYWTYGGCISGTRNVRSDFDLIARAVMGWDGVVCDLKALWPISTYIRAGRRAQDSKYHFTWYRLGSNKFFQSGILAFPLSDRGFVEIRNRVDELGIFIYL
jgi:hypothetical protein